MNSRAMNNWLQFKKNGPNKATTSPLKPLGIFWDIDNCPIPLTASASGVVTHIRKFVATRHPECGFAKEFVVATDIRRLSDVITGNLGKCGVFISHVNADAKNAADDKLEEHIQNFMESFADKSPVLVIITGDINFAKTIRIARKKDIVVVLIFGDHCSQDLKNCANESYYFADIIDGVEEVPNSSGEQKITYVKVVNLPKDKPFKDILRLLTRLLENCGGKPINYSDGSALVQFGSQEDGRRACRRFKGHTFFGKPCDMQLIDEGLDDCLFLQEFIICKSVIKGFPFKIGQNLKGLVIKLISEWNDPEVDPQFISKVEPLDDCIVVSAVSPRANQKLLGCAERNLSPESGIVWIEAKDFESSNGWPLGWYSKSPAEQVSDDRRSVIKGLSTRVDQNVTKVVKDLVDSWNDSQLSGSLIVSVERNTKQSDTDLEGKCNLFVTAVSAEASKILVKGAKQHIGSNLKWTPYKHKFQSSEEYKSVIKGLDTSNVKNITQYVRNIVNDWSDPRFKASFIVSVERNTYQSKCLADVKTCNLFVTATTPQTSRALIKGAKQYIKPEHNVKWTAYEPKYIFRSGIGSIDGYSDSSDSQCSYYSTTSTASVISNAMNKASNSRTQSQTYRSKVSDNSVANSRVSIITGMPTKKTDNVLKTVRKLVSDWKETNINGNMIEKVERDSIFALIDGKIPLFVTAYNVEMSKALVRAAQTCLSPNSGIRWTEFGSQEQRALKAKDSRPPLLPYPPFPPTYNPILPQYYPYFTNFPPFPQFNPLAQLFAQPFAQTVRPVQQTVGPSAHNINTVVKKTEPLPQNLPNIRQNSGQASPQPLGDQLLKLLDSVNKKLDSSESQPSMVAKEVPKKSPIKAETKVVCEVSFSSHKNLSFITGKTLLPYEDPAKAVRRMIVDWKDRAYNGNFIANVEMCSNTDPPILKVWTNKAFQTDALVAGAQRYLKADSGIVWTHSKPCSPTVEPKSNGESIAPTLRQSNSHPNKMFVICGFPTNHNMNVLILVRQLIRELFEDRVCADDIVEATRDYKWKFRDGNAMLFVTAAKSEVKDVILNSSASLEQRTGLKFKDYNGFKH